MAVAHPATVGMSLADCPDSAAGDCYPLCPAFIPPQCLTATIAYSKSLAAQPSPHSKSCPPKNSNRRPPLYSGAWGQAELKRTKCSFVFNGQVRNNGHRGVFLKFFSFFFPWVFPFGTGCVENHVSGPIPRRLSLLTSLFPLDPPFNGDNQRRHDRQRAAKNRRDFKDTAISQASIAESDTPTDARCGQQYYQPRDHSEVHIGKAQGDDDDDEANRVIIMTMKG